jgi:3-isopropylmalate/(R)-2-methylmalate dehydratase large subunit
MGALLFDKIWDAHVVSDLGDDWVLLHIDRHLLHDLSGPPAIAELTRRGLTVHDAALTFAVADHAVSTAPHRTAESSDEGAILYKKLKQGSRANGVRLFDIGEDGHGIVHVTAPELGLILPGTTVICGDSHTCTNGALGAIAFGIGQSESAHALATQTLRQKRPAQMRIRFEGVLPNGVTPKDLVLHAIGKFGTGAATGCAVEFAGSAIRAMPMEGRLTICNLSVELGARCGLIAPDETTIAFVRGRDFAPTGPALEEAIARWRSLHSDEDARFDHDLLVDVADVAPTITWGTSPEHAIPINGNVPDPSLESDPERRRSVAAALDYMGLLPGAPIAGTPVDLVFIGSCANSRVSDLRAAAAVVAGRTVAAGVTAWVVPGSERVKRECEAEGIDRVFLDAGFEWREPGCGLCNAANGERVAPMARAVSTSNRNFVGRQGPRARTHLASPAMAAAAAISGAICDVRGL